MKRSTETVLLWRSLLTGIRLVWAQEQHTKNLLKSRETMLCKKTDRADNCGRQMAWYLRSNGVSLLSAILFIGFAFATVLNSWHLIPELGCLFRERTGLPCPLCGMTRSIIATFEFHLDRAFSYNLFGPLLVVLLLVNSSAPFVPRLQERLAQWVETHGKTCAWAANLGKILFLLYSFGRMLYTYMNFRGSVAS